MKTIFIFEEFGPFDHAALRENGLRDFELDLPCAPAEGESVDHTWVSSKSGAPAAVVARVIDRDWVSSDGGMTCKVYMHVTDLDVAD